MAQYLLSVHHGEANALPADVDVEAMYEAVGEFNARLQEMDALVFAGGLQPPSSAEVAHADGTLTSGPALPTEAQMGGFWIVEAPDDNTARTWARDALRTGCAQAIEIRPFQTI